MGHLAFGFRRFRIERGYSFRGPSTASRAESASDFAQDDGELGVKNAGRGYDLSVSARYATGDRRQGLCGV